MGDPDYGNMNEKTVILVADNGATKCDWAAIGFDGRVERFETAGVNPALCSPDAVESSLQSSVGQSAAPHGSGHLVSSGTGEGEKTILTTGSVSEIWFYSAGAASDSLTLPLKRSFARMFPDAEVNVLSDMLGAARALCGTEPGVVGILGTGSNSCLYDGNDIAESGLGGGYVLGDEGSGAWFGKTLLADYIRNLLPADMSAALREEYSLDYQTIVENVYRSETPSRYLASFFPFVLRCAGMGTAGEFDDMEITGDGHDYAAALIDEGIGAFFRRCIMSRHYDFERYPVCFCGSIAWLCHNVIEHHAASMGVTLGRIMKSPIEGLVEYHLNAKYRLNNRR